MGGLAAVVGAEAAPQAVHSMLAAAPHRGERTCSASGEGWAVGVQARPGEDPFLGAALWTGDRCVVAVCGCLFDSDRPVTGVEAAERIATAWSAEGVAAVERLAGAYAAVCIDRDGARAVAVRSAGGERPLFVRDGAGAAFASEPKQCAAAPPGPPPPDVEAALDLVALNFEQPERTCYSGVRRLLPGTWVELRADERRERRFWRPSDIAASRRVGAREAPRAFARLLEQAVARRLRPGSAVLLSGGLDSGSVAAVASSLRRRDGGPPLPAVSAAYLDFPSVDESRWIRATAAANGCDLRWMHPVPRPFDDLAAAARLHDGPDIMPLSSNFRQILAAARDAGLRSLLDGHDADSVLGLPAGIEAALLRRGRLVALAGRVPFVARASGLSLPRAARRVLGATALTLAPSLFRRERGAGSPLGWVTGPLRERLAAHRRPRDWRDAEIEAAERVLPINLEWLERLAAAEDVSLVHPYADADLVDFLVRLPPEVKFQRGARKGLVRTAMPALPVSVRERAARTAFDAVAIAGAPRAVLVDRVREAPRAVPGVDWSALQRRVSSEDVPFAERALLGRLLTADLFLAGR